MTETPGLHLLMRFGRNENTRGRKAKCRRAGSPCAEVQPGGGSQRTFRCSRGEGMKPERAEPLPLANRARPQGKHHYGGPVTPLVRAARSLRIQDSSPESVVLDKFNLQDFPGTCPQKT